MSDIDLLIVNDDLVLNNAGIPELVSGRACIAQDIKHMIRESGLLVELIGNRDPNQVQLNLTNIEIKIEADSRIQPGTARVVQIDTELFLVTAKTIDYRAIEVLL